MSGPPIAKAHRTGTRTRISHFVIVLLCPFELSVLFLTPDRRGAVKALAKLALTASIMLFFRYFVVVRAHRKRCAFCFGGLRRRWGLSAPKPPRIFAEQNFHVEWSGGTGWEADDRERNGGLSPLGSGRFLWRNPDNHQRNGRDSPTLTDQVVKFSLVVTWAR